MTPTFVPATKTSWDCAACCHHAAAPPGGGVGAAAGGSDAVGAVGADGADTAGGGGVKRLPPLRLRNIACIPPQ